MKTTHVLLSALLVGLVLLTACGGGAAPPEPAPVEQPPVVEPAAPVVQPTIAAPVEPPPAPATEAPQPQYAPFCEAAAATSCTAPTVEMIDNKYCIEKVPYAIMSVPAGTTYESQDPDLECVDQVHNDGSLRVTCHSVTSKQLWSYDLKVCNGACSAAPSLQMGTGQCPDGYGFDAASQCCAAPGPASEAGCVIYQVDIGACPDPK